MQRAFDEINRTLFISGFADEISSDFEQQLMACQALGIHYLSLRGINGKNIKDFTYDEVQVEIVPKLNEYDIHVSSIGSPIGKIPLDDDAAFQQQCTILEELCVIANILSTRYIRIFSFYPKEGTDFDDVYDQVIKKLSIFVEIAQRYDVILLHENEKDVFGDIARRCVQLFEAIPSPHFKAVFDPANFVQMKEQPILCYEQLKNHIVYVHIKDATYSDDQNVVCGRGDGNIPELLSRLMTDGYQGFLTLEPHLVIFDSLKDLELKDVNEIIKEDKGLDPKEAYEMQYNALLEILKQVGGQYEKS